MSIFICEFLYIIGGANGAFTVWAELGEAFFLR